MDISHDPHSVFLDTGFDSTLVTITHGEPENGYYGGYVNSNPAVEFGARVDCVPHPGYGTLVSNLMIYHRGEEVMTYAGGWINKPRSEYELGLAKEIFKAFPERVLRPPLPTLKADFAKVRRDSMPRVFAERSRDETGRATRQFRQNQKDAGRGR